MAAPVRRTRSAAARKPARKPQTLSQVAAEVAARSPRTDGLRAELEEIAVAAGAFYRALREANVPAAHCEAMFENWHWSLWPAAGDADDVGPGDTIDHLEGV